MKLEDSPLVRAALLRKLGDRSAVIGVVGLGYDLEPTPNVVKA
jgi:hypothetical protein